jgi:hypothetical protein
MPGDPPNLMVEAMARRHHLLIVRPDGEVLAVVDLRAAAVIHAGRTTSARSAGTRRLIARITSAECRRRGLWYEAGDFFVDPGAAGPRHPRPGTTLGVAGTISPPPPAGSVAPAFPRPLQRGRVSLTWAASGSPSVRRAHPGSASRLNTRGSVVVSGDYKTDRSTPHTSRFAITRRPVLWPADSPLARAGGVDINRWWRANERKDFLFGLPRRSGSRLDPRSPHSDPRVVERMTSPIAAGVPLPPPPMPPRRTVAPVVRAVSSPRPGRDARPGPAAGDWPPARQGWITTPLPPAVDAGSPVRPWTGPA